MVGTTWPTRLWSVATTADIPLLQEKDARNLACGTTFSSSLNTLFLISLSYCEHVFRLSFAMSLFVLWSFLMSHKRHFFKDMFFVLFLYIWMIAVNGKEPKTYKMKFINLHRNQRIISLAWMSRANQSDKWKVGGASIFTNCQSIRYHMTPVPRPLNWITATMMHQVSVISSIFPHLLSPFWPA